MKKKNFIFVIIVLVLIIGVLGTILIIRGSIRQNEKISKELREAQDTFDIRLNIDKTEYYIYRLKPSANSDGATITIPDSIDAIPVTKLIDRDLGFSSYNKINQIIIGKNIKYIGTKASGNHDDNESIGDDFFSQATSLKTIEVDNENKFFSSENGVLYNKEKSILFRYPAGKTLSENQASHRFVIIDSVKKIFSKAFSLNRTLEMITFGENVMVVGDEAFSGCEALINVNFNQNIVELGSRAFERCRNLDTIVLPNNLKKLGSSVFYGCSNLVNIYFPTTILEINRNCFSGCTKLESIYIDFNYVNHLKELFDNINENNLSLLIKVRKNN